MNWRRASRRRATLALVAAAGLALSGAAPAAAEWYWPSGAPNAYGSIGVGSYTGSGYFSTWSSGRLDNSLSGTQKAHIRQLSASAATFYASNYGYPVDWGIGYSAGGSSYSYGRNAGPPGGPSPSGPINVRAGQF